MVNSAYIDGNGQPQQRLVKVSNGAHISYVALEDVLISADNALKIFNPPIEVTAYDVPAVSGVIALIIDTRGRNYLTIRVENTGTTAWTDFIIEISMLKDSNRWETIANGDYFFTAGQGEVEGNAMKLIRKCSPINPRTLASGNTSWLILFVPGIPQIRIRILGQKVNYFYTLENN